MHVLGQIEGVDLDLYKDIVLPRILEQVSVVYLYFLFVVSPIYEVALVIYFDDLYDKHVYRS